MDVDAMELPVDQAGPPDSQSAPCTQQNSYQKFGRKFKIMMTKKAKINLWSLNLESACCHINLTTAVQIFNW